MGCDEEPDVLACLQSRGYEELIEYTDLLGSGAIVWTVSHIWTEDVLTRYPQAVPDSSFSSNPFLPGLPEDLFSSGQFDTQVEIIIGTNKDEGVLSLLEPLLNPAVLQYVKDHWETVGVMGLYGLADVSEVTEALVSMSYKMLDFYVGGGVENIDVEDHLQGLFDMYTDSTFLYGVHQTIGHMLTNGVTVYQYMLTHRGQYSFSQLFGLPDPVGDVGDQFIIYI